MWIPPEETNPILLHAPTRKSISLFGAVNLKNGQFVNQFESIFNAQTFHDFLRKLIRHRSRNKKMVLVLDNARYHHATLLQPLLERYKNIIALEFLPPYSPDLNPIERVWKLTRRLCTHNTYFPLLSDLVNAVETQLNMWEKPNSTLYKLCGII